MNTPSTATRSRPFHLLRAGWAASVPLVCLATLAVLLAPHVRGIGFFPALRFAVVAPACLLVCVAAAFLYPVLVGRTSRPRLMLAAVLVGFAVLVLVGMAVQGPEGLVLAAAPALLGGAVAASWLVARFVDRPRWSRVGSAALLLLGVLEVVGVVRAVSSERASPVRELADAGSRFITLPSGARIHYVEQGQGETLLFLHGNPAWSYQWRELIRGLRGSYRCIALDYPGFGLSEAPAGFGFTPREQSLVVEEFAEQLQLRDVTLVMQDWGGPIGLGFAGRRPELVKRVVLGSTWAWPTSTGEPRGIFSVIAGGPVGEFLQLNFNGFASFGLQNGVVHAMPTDVLETYLQPFVPLERRGIAAFYPGQITAATAYFQEVEAGLPRLADKEALLFWAHLDQGFPKSDTERFEKVFPRHRTVGLPNANHFFFEDTAGQVIAEVRAFIPAAHP